MFVTVLGAVLMSLGDDCLNMRDKRKIDLKIPGADDMWELEEEEEEKDPSNIHFTDLINKEESPLSKSLTHK